MSSDASPATTATRRLALRAALGEWPPWLLAALVVALFHRVLVGGETLFLRDLWGYFLPQKQVLVDLLTAGELPLWNPFIQGGEPYLPSLASAALFPTTLLYLVVPPVLALNLSVVVALVVLVLGAYALARTLGLGRAAAVVAAAVAALAGPTLSLVNLLNHLHGFALLPWLLLLWDGAARDNRLGCFTAAAVVGVVQVFAGSPEATLLGLATLLLWSMAVRRPQAPPWSALGRWATLVALILAGAAVQLLPTAELAAGSARGWGIEVANLTQWSLYPKRLLELILPNLLGFVDQVGAGGYWGDALVDTTYPYLVSLYLGLPVVALAVLGAGRGSPLQPRLRVTLGLLAVAGPVLALGRFLPGASELLALLPLVTTLRYPAKLVLVAVLPTALLAAAGAEVLLAPERSRRPLPLLAALAALPALAVAGLMVWPGSGERLAMWLFAAAAPQATAGVWAATAHAAVFSACLLAVAWLARQRRPSWLPALLAAVVVSDLVLAGARVNPSVPSALVTTPPEVAARVAAARGDGRLYRVAVPEEITLHAPSANAGWSSRSFVEVLGGWSPALYQLPITLDADLLQLTPIHLRRLDYAVAELPWPARPALLGAAGVSVVLAEGELGATPLHPFGEVATRRGGRWALYANPLAAPPARVVTSWLVCPDDETTLGAMTAPGYDPRTTAVVAAAVPGRAPSGTVGELSLLARSNHTRRYRVRADGPALVVFTDPFMPGWSVTVDGVEAPILRADLAFQAVVVSAGEHLVVHRYLPVSFLVGTALSLATAVVLVVGHRRRWRWFRAARAAVTPRR